jgi:hypothetical protein
MACVTISSLYIYIIRRVVSCRFGASFVLDSILCNCNSSPDNYERNVMQHKYCRIQYIYIRRTRSRSSPSFTRSSFLCPQITHVSAPACRSVYEAHAVTHHPSLTADAPGRPDRRVQVQLVADPGRVRAVTVPLQKPSPDPLASALNPQCARERGHHHDETPAGRTGGVSKPEVASRIAHPETHAPPRDRVWTVANARGQQYTRPLCRTAGRRPPWLGAWEAAFPHGCGSVSSASPRTSGLRPAGRPAPWRWVSPGSGSRGGPGAATARGSGHNGLMGQGPWLPGRNRAICPGYVRRKYRALFMAGRTGQPSQIPPSICRPIGRPADLAVRSDDRLTPTSWATRGPPHHAAAAAAQARHAIMWARRRRRRRPARLRAAPACCWPVGRRNYQLYP